MDNMDDLSYIRRPSIYKLLHFHLKIQIADFESFQLEGTKKITYEDYHLLGDQHKWGESDQLYNQAQKMLHPTKTERY